MRRDEGEFTTVMEKTVKIKEIHSQIHRYIGNGPFKHLLLRFSVLQMNYRASQITTFHYDLTMTKLSTNAFNLPYILNKFNQLYNFVRFENDTFMSILHTYQQAKKRKTRSRWIGKYLNSDRN